MDRPSVAVIGCGIFGALSALKLAALGYRVSIFELHPGIMMGASLNNQSRLHLGFHYPRDLETGRQSMRGFESFRKEFQDAIVTGFRNAYFIAESGSMTSPDRYLAFCRELGCPFSQLDIDEFSPRIKGVAIGIECDEVVYDGRRLAAVIGARLSGEAGLSVNLGTAVTEVGRSGQGRFFVKTSAGRQESFDAVVNASYADINRLTSELGHAISDYQYEYTAVPVIEFDHALVGITVMDGPFMSLLPYGSSGQFTLYHVDHSVVARTTGVQMEASWCTPESSPFAGVDQTAWYERMVEDCAFFVPALRDARFVRALCGPRIVHARSDATDRRPSLAREWEPGYVTVFAGKVDHSLWVADDVVDLVNRHFGAHVEA
jgi:glycine/D-amino acid oxidase-like deaminating enzyme